MPLNVWKIILKFLMIMVKILLSIRSMKWMS